MTEAARSVWPEAFKAEVMAAAEECGLPGVITDNGEEGFSFFSVPDTVGTGQDWGGNIPPRWNLQHEGGFWQLSDNGRYEEQWNDVPYRVAFFSTLRDALMAVGYVRALTADSDGAAKTAFLGRLRGMF